MEIPTPGHIPQFRYFSQKVLPTVYDDSLSYLELLNKMQAKIDEIIEQLNTQGEAIIEIQEYLDELGG